MSLFICTLYAIALLCCGLGLYNNRFDANLLQRIGLVLFAFWSVWRVTLIYKSGWGYPHEPMIATAIVLFAVGTVTKTLRWRHLT